MSRTVAFGRDVLNAPDVDIEVFKEILRYIWYKVHLWLWQIVPRRTCLPVLHHLRWICQFCYWWRGNWKTSVYWWWWWQWKQSCKMSQISWIYPWILFACDDHDDDDADDDDNDVMDDDDIGGWVVGWASQRPWWQACPTQRQKLLPLWKGFLFNFSSSFCKILLWIFVFLFSCS